ncbi:mus81 structure-specific endonuclease subunit isoform X2 [Choristoneura fumiferana]
MRESPMPEVSCLDVLVVEMPAGSFDVILLIDKCETSGPSKKNDPTVVQFNKYPDLKHEYRSLKVGDFMWVAQHKTKTDQEIVLPYVVERKRMDDLGASIKDGRFHEQKFRLRKSGLENVIYLVENYGGNKHVGLPIQSLMQALQNTRVQDNFKVHETDSLKNSARFLAIMTKRLTTEYKDKNLTGYSRESKGGELMTFSFVNSASRKTKPLTVTETFIKLLLQLKGVSVEKALAITECYKTPRSLIEAYEECDKKEGEFLLANLKYGDLNRNVGPTVSKSVYHLFSNTNLA